MVFVVFCLNCWFKLIIQFLFLGVACLSSKDITIFVLGINLKIRIR